MKAKKRVKSPAKKNNPARLPLGMRQTREVTKSRIRKEKTENIFSAMETGQPDQDLIPDSDNPAGAQGGRGPLNQEGEGERQNDQLAELEQIEPDIV